MKVLCLKIRKLLKSKNRTIIVANRGAVRAGKGSSGKVVNPEKGLLGFIRSWGKLQSKMKVGSQLS